jgi:hypothetical protein
MSPHLYHSIMSSIQQQPLLEYEAMALPTVSDGVTSTHPTNTTPTPGAPRVNYYYPVKDQEAKDILWRTKTANEVARRVKITRRGQGQGYILAGFPEGYKQFVHVQGLNVRHHELNPLPSHRRCANANVFSCTG